MSAFNDSVYVFGGRGNWFSTAHDPRTFSTERKDGTVVFTSFNQKHVIPCFDADGQPQNVASLTPEAYAACYNTTVGVYMNDVWHYNMNCTRDGDKPCREGWSKLVEGALLGGCRNYNDAVHCTHPQERYGHSAAILYERMPINLPQERAYPAQLIIYGGTAQMCEDYCSDMWALNLTHCSLVGANWSAGCAWQEVGSLGNAGPGKRWRASSAHDNSRWVMFGGHRLWHGMAKGNSAANNWSDVSSSLPFGGFLDDLWVYTYDSRGVGEAVYGGAYNNGTGYEAKFGSVPKPTPGVYTSRELTLGPPVRPQTCRVGQGTCSQAGAWQQVLPREECFRTPGATYAERNALGCTLSWPPARAQAALALAGELVYLFGGYRVGAYPYPNVYSSGSADGTFSLKADGISPYPTQPQFLADLWRFDFRSGLWDLLQPSAAGGVLPKPRKGHSLSFAGPALILHGGYAGGSFLDDFWLYNTTLNHWLRKVVFPYPQFVPNCTSDFAPATPSNPLPLQARKDVAPDGSFTFYFSSQLEITRGYTGVNGSPALDGLYGRPSAPLFKTIQRRATFGWDGCTDRLDGRTDLPYGEVNFLAPSARTSHRAIWSHRYGILFVFGGEQSSGRGDGSSLQVADTWAWFRDACPFNCHTKGACYWGHCYCAAGFYGLDCSNRTCPGSVCQYNTADHTQTCMHCCSSGWMHTDGEPYVTGVRKVPCTFEHPERAEMNGQCDGSVGECRCAPPYMGDDCSIKDCQSVLGPTAAPSPSPPSCTDPQRGQCSVEYPVSRCMCNWPFSGDICEQQVCLNNCSYPNGVCDTSSGLCTCAAIKSPYDISVGWAVYEGDDCSWVPAFAGAGAAHLSLAASALAALLALALLWQGAQAA
jgi:hypothetical protein